MPINLTSQQYELILMVFSFATGVMGISSIFFFSQRTEVLPRYRVSMTLLSLVSLVAAYNYLRLYQAWREAAVVIDGIVSRTGAPYHDAYRYADWLTTVPLLLISFVCVLDLPRRQARSRGLSLALLGAVMVVFGYLGQGVTTVEMRWVWFCAGLIPFLIIQVQLYDALGGVISEQPPGARLTIKMARLGLSLSWPIYAAVYVLPLLDLSGPVVFLGIQVGYAAADIASKAFYGILIWLAAVEKSGPRLEALNWQSAPVQSAGD